MSEIKASSVIEREREREREGYIVSIYTSREVLCDRDVCIVEYLNREREREICIVFTTHIERETYRLKR